MKPLQERVLCPGLGVATRGEPGELVVCWCGKKGYAYTTAHDDHGREWELVLHPTDPGPHSWGVVMSRSLEGMVCLHRVVANQVWHEPRASCPCPGCKNGGFVPPGRGPSKPWTGKAVKVVHSSSFPLRYDVLVAFEHWE